MVEAFSGDTSLHPLLLFDTKLGYLSPSPGDVLFDTKLGYLPTAPGEVLFECPLLWLIVTDLHIIMFEK